VLGLQWFRDRATPEALARDHGVSRATADRYVDEVVAVLAEQALTCIKRWSVPKKRASPM
jgi:hypothetical protein